MKTNNNILQKKIFYIIPIFFIIIASIRITYAYYDIKKQEESFAKNQGRVLNEFFMVNRAYYQNLFVNHTLKLSEKTLPALPAFSAEIISKIFSKNNDLNITIKTVSDRARNPNNIANKYELEALNHFKHNKKEYDFFANKEAYYQYAYPLVIEQKCLTCHGKKENAPKFISDKYDKAYGYKLGDIRGIVSIMIPKKNLNKYFFKDFWYSVFYDFFIFSMLFIFMIFLIKKFKTINTYLRVTVKQKTEELSKQNSFLSSYTQALDQSSAISKTDPNGVITYANEKFCEVTGYLREELIGNTHSILRHPHSKKDFFMNLWETISNKSIWTGIIKESSKIDKEFISQVSIVPVLNNKNEITEFIYTRNDITELIRSKENIKQTLITDRLTQLKNRHKLLEDITQDKNNSFLCLLNIDGFKEINDFYGNKVADKLLIKVGSTIQKLCVTSNIYKLHADEFAVLSENISEEKFTDLVNQIINTIANKVFTVKGNKIHITISGGISFETRNLFICADMALQKAKQKKEHLFIYNESINIIKDITNNINGIKMLKDAIKKDTIVPFYQPIYNLKTSKIEKYESLARIILDKKVYAPFVFLDIAKRSKLYPHITKAVISKAFEYFKKSQFEFSINISIIDILNENTLSFIKNELKNLKDCRRVVFEILESEEIENFEIMKEFVKEVKGYGCKIAIDDFGSGYSNFSNILEMDVDYLKIDASLIKNITSDLDSKILVQGIVDFSKRLNIKTIAEYVETKESMELLAKIGVDYAQGYYIGKPQSQIIKEP